MVRLLLSRFICASSNRANVLTANGMKQLCILSLLLFTVQFFVTPHTTRAATTFSIESVDIGLGQADLKETTLSVIRWVLGIMTLVAVVMIIVSIVVAATSSDGDRAEKAKKGIAGAVIGLIIILLAWAIVFFVARTTTNVTSNS